MEIQHALLWFAAGTLAHHLISRVIGLCHGILLFQEVEKFAAVAATTLVRDTGVLLEYRLRVLEKSGILEEEELTKMAQSDATQLYLFKEVSLAKIRSSCAKHYLPYLKYSNWGELETYAADQNERKTQ